MAPEKKNNKQECKKCNGTAKESKAYGNAYALPNEKGDKTIIEGRGDLIDCLKCTTCGHSWVPAEKPNQ